jgi:SM-20-related protein
MADEIDSGVLGGIDVNRWRGSAGVSAFEATRYDQPVPFVIVDEFLSAAQLAALLEYTLDREQDFIASEVVGTMHATGILDLEHRRSRSLFDLRLHRDVIAGRIESSLPRIFAGLGREPFTCRHIEAHLCASNDGEFFKRHSDNGVEALRTREITFAYYFHREPKAFFDGDLRIYTSFVRAILARAPIRSETIVPLQNRIVFFPSCMLHEVLPVRCPSRAFADSRFSVTGWVHR